VDVYKKSEIPNPKSNPPAGGKNSKLKYYKIKTMVVLYLLLIFIFCFLLIKATDILMVNLKSLVSRTKFDAFAISSLIVGLGTSLPELFVGITAAMRGTSELSLGNVVGANIANLSLVIGGAALIGGTVYVQGEFLRRDIFWAFLAGATPMLLLFDKQLSRVDGIILLAFYGFYQTAVFREQKKGTVFKEDEGFIQRLIRRLKHRETRRELGWIFLAIAILLFSGEMIVRIAKEMALSLDLPLILVGLLLVSLGTTLPELFFELEAIKRKESEMVFGNLSGSIVANGTLIIGLVSLISPLKDQVFAGYFTACAVFIFMFFLFYYFVRTKRKLERWEGGILLGLYFVFLLLELSIRRGF